MSLAVNRIYAAMDQLAGWSEGETDISADLAEVRARLDTLQRKLSAGASVRLSPYTAFMERVQPAAGDVLAVAG